MSTGQTLLALMALSLLSYTILNVNRSLMSIDTSLDQNRYRLEALSLATSYIEQTSQYFFDEVVADTNSVVNSVSDLTPVSSFGFDNNDYDSELGRNIPDDFDDFNDYVKVDTGRSGVIYNVSFKVEYVKLQGSQIIPTTSKQYHKMMTIYVTDTYDPPLLYKYVGGKKVRDTLKISFIYSYWFYN
jgi:hypothetical protein